MSAGYWICYCQNGHLISEFGEGTADFFGDHLPTACPYCGSTKFASASEDGGDFPKHIGETKVNLPFEQNVYDQNGQLVLKPEPGMYTKGWIPVYDVARLFKAEATE